MIKRIDNEEMRTTILDAVIACKCEACGAAVSLSQISSRAGISERTLNRYFPDKELMMYEAAIKYLKQKYVLFAKLYIARDKSRLNACERLLLLIQMQIDNYKSDTAEAMVYVRAFTTAMCTAAYHQLPAPGFDAPTRNILISCVEEGLKDGSIHSSIEPLDVYFLVSSNFNGLIQRLVYIYSLEIPREEHEKKLFHVFEKYMQMLESET